MADAPEVTRAWLSVLVVVGGCEQWKAPERVRELEGRVDELSAEVSALTGKPVGAPKKKGEGHDEDKKDHEDTKDPEKKGDKDGTVAKTDDHASDDDKKHDKDDKSEHDDKHDKDDKSEHDKDEDADEPHELPHWTYAGESGPAKWASMAPAWKACGGESQSPIDLELRPSQATPIKFDYKPTPASVVDNGHTLQVNLDPGSKITLDGKKYELVQFHVHTPSEHTIAGESYPMELHLVHKSQSGQLAVIGVMYEVGSDGKALEPVWAKWPKKVDVPAKLKASFDPTTLLPESRTVVQYRGSLTTPPCTEGVKWNVMRRTRTMSRKELDELQKHYPKNARPIMPRGERILL